MPATDVTQARRKWMATLAKAEPEALLNLWQAMDGHPAYAFLRKPEIGLAMIRARAGGEGQPFNLGEMTVTRCAVRTDTGSEGHAYVAGRQPKKAEIAAVLDAILQTEAPDGPVHRMILAPLNAAAEAKAEITNAETAETRVDFFTMVRGE